MFNTRMVHGEVRILRRVWYLSADGQGKLRSIWIVEAPRQTEDKASGGSVEGSNRVVTQACDTESANVCA